MSLPIEDYALIGDGETTALVSREGSIDWLCWPRFDSAACFAALLGDDTNGRWQIRPKGPFRTRARRYRPDTLVLETDLECDEGAIRLIDFMPWRTDGAELVRIVRGLEGRVPMSTDYVVRFDYGSIIPWVTQVRGATTELHAVAGPDMLTLRTTVPLHGEDARTVGTFEVAAGEEVTFVLAFSASHCPPPPPVDAHKALVETEEFWRSWTNRCRIHGPWREAVNRSLITLKALIYAPTGGIVAAPTTSLPEKLRGPRNWDYRYCWLRDATFTLLALMDAGYYEEAEAWRAWLVRALAGAPAQAQIMYGVAGERRLTEWEVPWLRGYEDSRPVRVGNAAAAQLQLDVYGEVADAMQTARRGGLAPSQEGWAVQRALTGHVEKVWEFADAGIWEMRGPPQHFTHSKIMAWVALDRAIRAIEDYGQQGPVERWRAVRERIHKEVCERGFDPKLGSFVQAYGSKELDASLLLIPLVGFLPAEDPRMRGTLAAIEERLLIDGLIVRYRSERVPDGLPPGEGAFLACSFWYVDNLVLAGRKDEARERFERLLELRNDVGLLAEEYDPRARRQLGNFPQAFSHVALLDSAYNLQCEQSSRPAEQRGGADSGPGGKPTARSRA